MASSSALNATVAAVKILYSPNEEKVLYLSAGKDFFDVLMSVLTLPLASIVNLLQSEKGWVGKVNTGSLENILEGFNHLPSDCLRNEMNSKEALLNQVSQAEKYCSTLAYNLNSTQVKDLYICSSGLHRCGFLSHSEGVVCKCRKGILDRPIPLEKSLNGFLVDSKAEYILKDDLCITPFAVNASAGDLVKDTGSARIGSLMENDVTFTQENMLDFLKCCLLSKTPLSDYYFRNKSWEKNAATEYEPLVEFEDNPPSDNRQIELKPFVRKSDGVVFAAFADKCFVELVVSFLTYPLGSVVKVLNGKTNLGNIDNLYNSVSFLNNQYLPSEAKNLLLEPPMPFHLSSELSAMQGEDQPVRYYCYSRHDTLYVTDAPIPDNNKLKKELILYQKFGNNVDRSFLIDHKVYMAHLGLMFRKLKPDLSHLDIDLESFKETRVMIGQNQCLQILRASLTSSKALHDGLYAFLSKSDPMIFPEVVLEDDSEEISSIRTQIDNLYCKLVQLNDNINTGVKIEDGELADLISAFEVQLQSLESVVSNAKVTVKRGETEITRAKRYINILKNKKE